MAARFCCTCIHWEANVLHRIGEEFGICHEVVVNKKVMQDGETKLSESTTFYTEKYFGCIYWRENNGVIIKLKID